MLKKAVEIAIRAHDGQRDKGGHPYIAHPLRVMLAIGVEDEALASIAVLHDVVEDSEVTLADLAEAGFPPRVTEALALLNHARGEPYMKYVARLSENPDARRVKLADLEDNLDETRLPGLPSEADLRRMRKYEAARDFLIIKGHSMQEKKYELDKAKAETERLKNALREIAEHHFEWASSNEARIIEGTFRAMAREALEKQP